MKKSITGNEAVSYGVLLSRVEVISAYPITPQTTIVEKLSNFCAEEALDADFIPVESEHSAMACCIGAASTGVRTFTATSGQGLALMHELLHWASGARLPIVMANVNRTLGAPWTSRCDQNDSLSQRDTGWIHLYCEDNQEVLDTIIQAYKISESVLIPSMVLLDGFLLSHTTDIVEIPEQTSVDDYLPKYRPRFKLDLDDPRSFSPTCTSAPLPFFHFRYNQHKAVESAIEVAKKADAEFYKIFGRRYGILESYNCEDADLILVTSGTATGTARVVVEGLREEKKKVGLLKIKMLRPFPTEDVRRAIGRATKIAVIDRNISFGMGGIFAQEIKSALYGAERRPQLFGFVAGLGGMDITPNLIKEMAAYALENERPINEVAWFCQ